jgi:hypothetical protein
MSKLSAFFALIALCLAGAVFANGVATTVNGTVQVVRGTSPAGPLRQGDEVNQGDTVTTGANSSVVLKFDDGQVAALTANSRMTITSYQYDTQKQSGNVLLSLINGGMRAITGLIGKNTPNRVTYRAATTTIGIRGTGVSTATNGRDVVAIVQEGSITVTVGNRQYTVNAGQGIDIRFDGTVRVGSAEDIRRGAPTDLGAPLDGLQALTDAINRAAPGQPREGITAPEGIGNTGTPGIPSGGAGGTPGTPVGNPASPS